MILCLITIDIKISYNKLQSQGESSSFLFSRSIVLTVLLINLSDAIVVNKGPGGLKGTMVNKYGDND